MSRFLFTAILFICVLCESSGRDWPPPQPVLVRTACFSLTLSVCVKWNELYARPTLLESLLSLSSWPGLGKELRSSHWLSLLSIAEGSLRGVWSTWFSCCACCIACFWVPLMVPNVPQTFLPLSPLSSLRVFWKSLLPESDLGDGLVRRALMRNYIL